MATKEPKKQKGARKPPRWENEEWVLERPDPKRVQCRNCQWRAEDRKLSESTTIQGSTLGTCKVFSIKPNGVTWGTVDCPYYLKETGGSKD